MNLIISCSFGCLLLEGFTDEDKEIMRNLPKKECILY
jgi:hypothetical protein